MYYFLAILLSTLALTEANRTCSSFIEYTAKYGKVYSGEEFRLRSSNWASVKKYIDAHNGRFDQGLETYTLTDNPFADMTAEEKELLIGAHTAPDRRSSKAFQFQSFDRIIPSSLDLTNTSCMPPIKNQGLCGGCYAFVALNPIEYQYCVKKGRRILLSEQQVISCSSDFGNQGCSGGYYYNTWEYIFNVGGVARSSEYPYASTNGILPNNCYAANVTKVANVVNYAILMKNETVIKQAVAIYGPVAVSLAINVNFQYYSSGLYKDPTCVSNAVGYHAVTLVGYGTDQKGQAYWIARNSWGVGWGIRGYALIARDINQCGIAEYAAFPMIA